MIQLTIQKDDFINLIYRQISSFFPCSDEEKGIIETKLDIVLNRLDTCLHSRINGYLSDLNGGQNYKVQSPAYYPIFNISILFVKYTLA